MRTAGAVLLEHQPGRRWQRQRLPPDVTVEQALERLRLQPEVEYAEPNYIARKAETAPNDTEFTRQWGLENMKLPLAWDHATGDGSVIVAVVDSGITHDHPDLVANLWINPGETPGNGLDDDANGIIDDIHGVNYNGSTVNGAPRDDDTADWHGTHVAGIVGAVGNNGQGVSGVNWQIRLMAVKVLHGPSGSGTTSDIVKGIDYAIAQGAHIVNLSLTLSGYSNALADALGRADAAGVLTVSAAGNAGTNNDTLPNSPAAIRTPNNIAVAAITKHDVLAGYSNYGRLSVDLAAPGGAKVPVSDGIYSTVGTLSATDFDNYGYLAGTSMATPHISGLAALLRAHLPGLTHRQIKARLLAGARRLGALNDRTIAGGTADAYAALTSADLPAVFRVVPSSAYAGEVLTVTGVNFGSAAGRVNAGPLELPLASAWSDDLVQVTVPSELSTGYVRLHVNAEGSGFFIRRLNRTPVVTLDTDPGAGNAPLAVTLIASASDTDGAVVRHEWDLGDGVFSRDSGTAPMLEHVFTGAGTHALRVRVTDNDGGTAIASTTIKVKKADHCFIATAAWGSPMADEVRTLRRFRDDYLLTHGPGRAFVRLYYAASPPLAAFIRDRVWLRAAVRALLRPVASLAGWFVSDAQAAGVKPRLPDNDPGTVPGEYLVGFRAGTTEDQAHALIAGEGGALREYYPAARYGLAVFPAEQSAEDVVNRLLVHETVRYAEPNRLTRKP